MRVPCDVLQTISILRLSLPCLFYYRFLRISGPENGCKLTLVFLWRDGEELNEFTIDYVSFVLWTVWILLLILIITGHPVLYGI